MAGIIVGIVALPLAIAFGYSIGSNSGKRTYHSHCRRVHRIGTGWKFGANRRTARGIYRHRIRYHTRLWARRIGYRHSYGGRLTGLDGAFPSGRNHQIHSLSYRRGVHQRYRIDHFHDTNQRLARTYGRQTPLRLSLSMGGLFQTPRHHQPHVALYRCGKYSHHCHHAQNIP